MSTAQRLARFEDVFPRRKLLNRALFELDSRWGYRKLLPVYKALYYDPNAKTNGLAAKDLTLMQEALQRIRLETRIARRDVHFLEDRLLNRAAEMGDNNAIAQLAFQTLSKKSTDCGNNKEELKVAQGLIKQLYGLKHPLTIKLLGDLAMVESDYARAKRYYKDYLLLNTRTSNDLTTGLVHGKLGEIAFHGDRDLAQAEHHWLECLKLVPLIYSVKYHFYLSQLYSNSDPGKSKIYLHNCASQGFRESFRSLGFLELNYYGNVPLAQEWFRLGMELYSIECYFGFFDSSMKLKQSDRAKKSLQSLLTLMETREMPAGVKSTVDQFLKSRATTIRSLVKDS